MFVGKTIAPGIALGPALVWAPARQPVPRRQVPTARVNHELHRFQHAVHRARRELEEIALGVATTFGGSAAAIFSAHGLMLHDASFLDPIVGLIETKRFAAESAVAAVVEQRKEGLARLGNSYLAARAQDLDDLGERLLTHLRKEGGREVPRPGHPVVLIAENLAAADVIALDRAQLLALVMVQSGTTSHAAILASTLGIPVVCGVTRVSEHVREGDPVIVDGNHGHVIVKPAPLAVREYQTRRELFDRFCGEVAGLRDVPAVTADGRIVRLTANIGLAQEIPQALAQGAEGIGLLRTEYFYLGHGHPPSEQEQYEFYAEVVRAMAPRPVTFRVLDLGGDKADAAHVTAEANPMLGCRGIRLLLERQDLFVAQMRALLRASHHGEIRIMFPLITSLTEFQDTMQIVRKVSLTLEREGHPFDPHIRFGCMVETPAAATIPDILATEVEFFSIGSNDLIQCTLAADRTNPRVAYVYEPLHLAVLRMMWRIIHAARRKGRPVSLCGEMAADPIYTIILLGLGVDELSMNPVMIPAIKQIIRSVTWEEARKVAHGVLRERRAKDVQTYLEKMMANRFPQVMSIYGHEEPFSAESSRN